MRELRISSKKNNWPENWGKKTSIMGIINLTPDSFSDGGEISNIDRAIDQVNNFLNSGVDVVDIGAQSTRPGAVEVGPQVEISRLIPTLRELRCNFPNILISVDTFHSEVAEVALSEGANWINDVTGGRRDEKILDVVASYQCPYVITHSRGNSQNMNKLTNYDDIFKEITLCLESLTEIALKKKICKENIIWDPGLGFSKDTSQNITVLQNLEKLKEFGFPVLIGASRKRFIGDILNESNPQKRDIGTLAISCLCSQFKINIVRVHNVFLNYQILKIADKIYRY